MNYVARSYEETICELIGSFLFIDKLSEKLGIVGYL